MKNNGIQNKFGSNEINYKPIFIIIAILSILTTLLIDHKTPIDYRKLMRISLISLFFGLIIEHYRITKNWLYLFYNFFGTYFLSLAWFLFNRKSKIEQIIEFWPFFFIGIFLLISLILYSEKLTQKLTEGFTLLLSLAFIYWLIEKGIFNFNTFLNSILTLLTVFFSGFSIFNSLSYVELNKSRRLWLSVWTTIIILVISIDNAISVLKNTYNDYIPIYENLFLALQYFLLGISSVYTAQNLNLIYSLLDKDTRRKAKRHHTQRYSETQVSIRDSVFCILFSGMTYFLNYYFNILPKNLMIWSVIFVFPILLSLIKIIKQKNNYI